MKREVTLKEFTESMFHYAIDDYDDYDIIEDMINKEIYFVYEGKKYTSNIKSLDRDLKDYRSDDVSDMILFAQRNNCITDLLRGGIIEVIK